MAHPGAADYINDDTKSFMDTLQRPDVSGRRRAQHHRLDLRGDLRQGDAHRAGEGQRALHRRPRYRRAHASTPIRWISSNASQDELEGILRGAVIGLRDGTISSDGLDTFKLGYEFVRDEIGMRREALKRQGHDAAPSSAPAHEDNGGGEDGAECAALRARQREGRLSTHELPQKPRPSPGAFEFVGERDRSVPGHSNT